MDYDILGVLTNYTGTNDLRLRTPVDQKIYYNYEANPALARQIYDLPDLSGSAGGGKLAPIPDPGTVIFLK